MSAFCMTFDNDSEEKCHIKTTQIVPQDDWQPNPVATSGMGLDQACCQRYCQEQGEGCGPVGEPERCGEAVQGERGQQATQEAFRGEE